MAVALVSTPTIPKAVEQTVTLDTSFPPLQDTFSLPPPWGGERKDFFRIFEGHRDGLTRRDVLNNTSGDPQIVAACFQHVITEAVEAGLLVLRESGTTEDIESAGLKATKVDFKETIFLNFHSERLRRMMHTQPSELITAVDNFSNLNFDEIAGHFAFAVSGNYAERFKDFLSQQFSGKKLYETDFLNNRELYPTEESSYTSGGKAFIYQILEKAVEFSVLKRELEPSGRPFYTTPEGLQEVL